MWRRTKKEFQLEMIIMGLITIGMGFYFNYETLFLTEDSFRKIRGQIASSKSYVEEVSFTSRFGTKSYSYRATLEFRLRGLNKTFRIFENIGQQRTHLEYDRIKRRLIRRKEVILTIPKKPLKDGPDFIELYIDDQLEIGKDQTLAISNSSFWTLSIIGLGLIGLSQTYNWWKFLH